MIVDTLENLEKYAGLNPLFAQAVEFLKSHEFECASGWQNRAFRAKTWVSMWHKQS
jgi:beta-galactosidase beta subunit